MVQQPWFRAVSIIVGILIIVGGIIAITTETGRALSGLVVIVGLVILIGGIFPQHVWRGGRRD